jgi:hypothetical protein
MLLPEELLVDELLPEELLPVELLAVELPEELPEEDSLPDEPPLTILTQSPRT